MSTTTTNGETRVEDALKAFRAGKPVLVYDFDEREGEVDIIFPATAVRQKDIAQLRNYAGGLICVALAYEVCETFDLLFLAEELSHRATETGVLDYGDRSSFSLPVNHRKTRTGVTDADRSLTIRELGKAALDPDRFDFAAAFRAPGHVPVLKGAPGLLSDRRGHTELGLTLARLTNQEPAVVVCEMLDDETGAALSESDARLYAQANCLPFLRGETLCNFGHSK